MKQVNQKIGTFYKSEYEKHTQFEIKMTTLINNELSKLCNDKIIDVRVILKYDGDSEYIGSVYANFIFGVNRVEEKIFVRYDDDIEDIAIKLNKEYDYINSLIEKYPKNAELHWYIQNNRVISKCSEYGGIKYELTDMLILPNTTKCSFGGGDYEIKRVESHYCKKYLKRCDEVIQQCLDVITEVNTRKQKLLNIINKTEQ